MKRYILFLFFYCILFSLYAQHSKDQVVALYLKVGKDLIQQKKYDSAVVVLRSGFIKDVVLPDELLYYYSLALFHSGDVQQSKKMVEKLLTFIHPSHELYNSSKLLLNQIDNEIDHHLVMCDKCKGIGYFLVDCAVCHHTGKLPCTVCDGQGKVLIGVSNGMKVGVCTICMGSGVVSCAVCEGLGKKKEICIVCKGKGKK